MALFTVFALVFALASALVGCARDDRDPPNIIIITADDMGPHTGSYRDRNASTPNLDRMANEGVLFTRAYVTQASCSPSRSSILTGLYPHQNGQLGLTNAGFAMDPGIPNLPTILHNRGYYTGEIGKHHVEPDSELRFDFKDNRNTRDMYEIASLIEDFISRQDSLPFFLMVNLADPHKTRSQYSDAFQVGGIPSVPWNESDVDPLDFVGLNTKEIRIVTAGYYNCVRRLDFGVGLLLEILNKHQLIQNTMIVFISDNGPPFTRAKATCYEAGLRIPFIVKWPVFASKGVVRKELVSTVDILPTVLDAAGIEALDNLPGKSLLSLLRGESAKWRQTLCAEYNAHEREAFYPRRSIRNDRYKLILNLLPDRDSPYWAAGECPAWMASRLDSLIGTEVRGAYDTYLHPPQVELYDLLRDPNEWRNLADDPRHDKIKGDLVKQLRRWRKATQDPYLDPDKLEKDTKKYLEK